MSQRRRTILAIDPATRGCAFVALESPEFLVDWGLRGTRARTKRELLAIVGELIDTHQPDVVVVEDPADSRRGKRAIAIVGAIEQLAGTRSVRCRRVSRRAVRRAYQLMGAATTHAVAERLAEQFPELSVVIPPRRKVYMSQDERMHIFAALAFALAAQPRAQESSGRAEIPGTETSS